MGHTCQENDLFIHPQAWVSQEATLGSGCWVGPFAVIEAGARLGARVHIEAGAYVGNGVEIADDCFVGPRAVLLSGVSLGQKVNIASGAVLGTDGFGYVFDGSSHRKIPQVGKVEIGDQVRIGFGSCVDRATTGTTSIGAGSTIGAMVMVAHNCHLGSQCQVGSQTGLAGSSVVGERCRIGYQCGMALKAELGDDSQALDRAGLLKKYPPGSCLSGTPARPVQEVRKIEAALSRLSKLLHKAD